MAAAAVATFAVGPVAAQSVTIGGSFTAQIVSVGPGSCGPTHTTVSALLSGFLSPFGAMTGSLTSCFDPPNFTAFDGQFTLTFPGGGTLFGTHVGTFTPTGPGTFTGASTFTITGGTGHFAGATGTAASTGTQNLNTGTGTGTVNGTVSAPGLVPEPSTVALMAGGLVGLAVATRRRRVA